MRKHVFCHIDVGACVGRCEPFSPDYEADVALACAAHSKGPQLEPYVITSIITLISRVIKLSWYDHD